jgi:hypothetical protein
MAYFVDGEDGQPHIILALLPFPLLMAQWGMLLTVFYQSIEDCTSRNRFCFCFIYPRLIELRETVKQSGTISRALSTCSDS